MAGEFRITGRHVLFGMVGFFGLIIAVNAVFITLAVRSFPGEQERKSYLQGVNYNDRLAERAAQETLGWTVSLETAALQGDDAVIEIAFRHNGGGPLYDLDVAGVLSRPVDDDADVALAFQPAGPGIYRTSAPAGPGAWNLAARATSRRGERFDLETRIVLE